MLFCNSAWLWETHTDDGAPITKTLMNVCRRSTHMAQQRREIMTYTMTTTDKD